MDQHLNVRFRNRILTAGDHATITVYKSISAAKAVSRELSAKAGKTAVCCVDSAKEFNRIAGTRNVISNLARPDEKGEVKAVRSRQRAQVFVKAGRHPKAAPQPSPQPAPAG